MLKKFSVLAVVLGFAGPALAQFPTCPGQIPGQTCGIPVAVGDCESLDALEYCGLPKAACFAPEFTCNPGVADSDADDMLAFCPWGNCDDYIPNKYDGVPPPAERLLAECVFIPPGATGCGPQKTREEKLASCEVVIGGATGCGVPKTNYSPFDNLFDGFRAIVASVDCISSNPPPTCGLPKTSNLDGWPKPRAA